MTLHIFKHILKSILHFLTWVLIVFTLLGGVAGYIDPTYWAGPAMLCLIFPEMWPLTLIAGILWWVLSRDKFTAIGASAVLILTLPAMLTVFPVSFPSEPEPGEKTIKIMTYNALGGHDKEMPDLPYSRTFSYIIGSGADIVCLQEMYDITAPAVRKQQVRMQLDSIENIYPYRVNNNNLDLALLSKWPIEYSSGEMRRDLQYFTYQLYKINAAGTPLTVINLHLSSYALTNSQRNIAVGIEHDPLGALKRTADMRATLYGKLSNAFEVRADAADYLVQVIDTIKGPIIVCGDFNDVPGSWCYKRLRSVNLNDAYSDAAFGPMVTFNDNHLLFHIDQIFYRKGEGMRPYDIERGRLRSSDHYPVIASFALKQ